MLKSLLSLFLQSQCPLCDRPTSEDICQYCQQQLKSYQQQDYCQFWSGKLPVFIWGIYDGKLKRAIASLKYENHPEIGKLMGIWLGEAWLNSPAVSQHKNVRVVPIPLHTNRWQQRGFNQAEIIAKSFCQFTGYKLYSSGLKRIRDTQQMFSLNPAERENNVKNAFILGKDLSKLPINSPILIVDDIYTTGTTAREAAKILQANRIAVLGIAAIASSKA